MEETWDILHANVHLAPLSIEEQQEIRGERIGIVKKSAYDRESIMCRVKAVGKLCKRVGVHYKLGDVVLIPRPLEIPKAIGFFLDEKEILATVEK